ncbi:MAG: flavin reductase [Eubacteriales bacterium]|nr:flavin reductase [Eubacteriales bacterium]
MDPKAMFRIGYGLYVLTAKEGYKNNGCIINTAVQVTYNPNRLSICVNKLNYTDGMIWHTGEFNLSVLTVDAPFKVYTDFGFCSGRDTDKFAGRSDFTVSPNGILYMTELTNAYISCKVVSAIDLGTHTMFIADVTDGELLSDAESVTYAYYHSNIKPKPAAPTVKKGWRCRICGYIYEGEILPDDFICPICKHGAEDFERIEL